MHKSEHEKQFFYATLQASSQPLLFEIIMDKLSFSLSIYSLCHMWLIIASNLAYSINLWLRFLNLPHSVEQITCHLVTHYFSILLQNSPKKVSHSFICMFVYSNCTPHNVFWGFFGRMEVRLFLTINHSGPLMTRSFPERGQREQVGDVKSGHSKSQISVIVQVNEFWMSGTKYSVPG